jgi:hypothetical protein
VKHPTRNRESEAAEEVLGPEVRLWMAVLYRGVEDAKGNGTGCKDRTREDMQDEALDWVFSYSERLGGFVWVMRAVGLGGDSIRQARRALEREIPEAVSRWRRRRGEEVAA